MNIGIITFHCAVNYGAALQTYALCRYLEDLGHYVSIIDYQPDELTSPYTRWRWDKWCGLHPSNFVKYVKRKRFSQFWERHYLLTQHAYFSMQELLQDPPLFDAYICGSDQIWNPEVFGGKFDPAYFLRFAEKNSIKIAYAASFGTGSLADKYADDLSGLTKGFSAVSMREASGVEYLSKATGISSVQVADPTLLWGKFDDLIDSKKKAAYSLCYLLQRNKSADAAMLQLKREIPLPLHVINGTSQFRNVTGFSLYPSPEKWLELFKHASIVVTNSFHGVVFSILFKRNFIVSLLSGSMAPKNTRITELLNQLGLAGRILCNEDGSCMRRILQEPINWDEVDGRISKIRELSSKFLLDALGGAND